MLTDNSIVFSLRVRPEVAEQIKANADQIGLPLTHYLRFVINVGLKYPGDLPEEIEADQKAVRRRQKAKKTEVLALVSKFGLDNLSVAEIEEAFNSITSGKK